MEHQIKLIDKDTVIPKLTPMDWDVVVKGRPFYVAHIPGYVHCIRGWGEPIDLWAWPRNEEPSYDNLVEYELDSPVAWGLNYHEGRYIKCKWDDTMLRGGAGTTITRNDEDFYYVPGGRGYSIPKALMLIGEIQEHPLNFCTIDFDKKMVGRKIWYNSQPAIIERYINGQCCVMIIPDGAERFETPAEFAKEPLWDEEDARRLKIDCLADKRVWWFRD